MSVQPPDLRKVLAVGLAMVVLAIAALALLAVSVWTDDIDRGGLYSRMLLAVLGVGMAGFAAIRFFWDAPRSRRPRWQRAYAILLLLWAGYCFVLAFRGW